MTAATSRSDASPRYNARDLALYRGRQEGCPVVLGSATPCLESYHAALSGKLNLLTLTTRATGSNPPKVQHRGHARAVRAAGRPAPVHPLARGPAGRPWRPASRPSSSSTAAATPIAGSARTAASRANARIAPCPLVYHKALGSLICHYCGFSVPAASALPQMRRRRVAGHRPRHREGGGIPAGHLPRGRPRPARPGHHLRPSAGPRRSSPASAAGTTTSCWAPRWWPRAMTSPR